MQHVVNDLVKKITNGLSLAFTAIKITWGTLAGLSSADSKQLIECPLLNSSVCPAIMEPHLTDYLVLLYNPHSQGRNFSLCLPVLQSVVVVNIQYLSFVLYPPIHNANRALSMVPPPPPPFFFQNKIIPV